MATPPLPYAATKGAPRHARTPRRSLAAAARALISLAILVLPHVARAQADDGGGIEELEAELGRAATVLASASCATACPALASMRRAADRICILEPGPRCDAARAKLRDAERRVAAECPECAAPPRLLPPPPAQAAPSAAPRSGGCAGCAVPGDPRGAGLGALAALAVLATLAHRRRRGGG